MPKDESPIREHDCFAFFDEARSRGADLKLKQNALALVTIGPNMLKDKLMQAIGRMRLLFAGQKLCFVGTCEVTDKIEAALSPCVGELSKRPRLNESTTRITSKHVLCWVVLNTIQYICDALVEWARQGAIYATSRTPETALLDELNTLEEMYGAPLGKRAASEVISSELNQLEAKAAPGSLGLRLSLLLKGIQAQATIYGREFDVVCTTYEEEYERELEKEVCRRN
jgi:hypothetical protein